ncbi:Peptidyl-tRNA hydrolase [Planctopirus ephydatiae]|uniref:Peptidyl-tRNA hydrolase n=1 Tax=Planctopirus ephydatiae TaxID=2528019 RepID=A0A518GS92_9PLAN|nr:aminoacyl-tRNA hydrolase [Planctopirus ephydatiae]QDV31453.1 Peptidyl-tRNA hydrolase [Planctopirus ephydatiae]
MKCIVGLGNPGGKFVGTRHNIGWEVTAELSTRGGGPGGKSRFDAITREVVLKGVPVILLEPQTFMNLSGRSVGQIAKFYKMSPADFLIVCDDLNLPLGKLRVRAGGSSGGQKGLADILQVLGTDAVPRLRLGVGRPPGTMDAATFVLAQFRKDERIEVDLAVATAADAAEVWLADGVDSAMNRFNVSADQK